MEEAMTDCKQVNRMQSKLSRSDTQLRMFPVDMKILRDVLPRRMQRMEPLLSF